MVLTSKLQIYEMKLGPILSYFHVEQYRLGLHFCAPDFKYLNEEQI